MWLTRVRRSLTLIMAPVLVGLMALSINSPSDTWRGDWGALSNQLANLSVLVDVVVALTAAWESGRISRSGLSRLELSFPRSSARYLLSVIITTSALGLLVLAGTGWYMASYELAQGSFWPGIIAESAAGVFVSAAFGVFVGTVWRSRLAAPAAGVVIYVWTVFGESYWKTGRPQSLVPLSIRCCDIFHSVNGRSLVAALIWLGALGVAFVGGVVMLANSRSRLLSRESTLSGGLALIIVLSGGILVVAKAGGSQVSLLRRTVPQTCGRSSLGIEVCDYSPYRFVIPIYERGADYALTHLAGVAFPHYFTPVPYYGNFQLHVDHGYLGGSFGDLWAESTDDVASSLAASNFQLMWACASGLRGTQLNSLQMETQLANQMINNHLLHSSPGPEPLGLTYPEKLAWAPWVTQRTYISSTWTKIRQCRPIFLNQ